MVVRSRKKNSRQRGSTTHGWGSMKKHRGKGNKGGSGLAGTGKRGDAKKPSVWKEEYFGKKGFKKKGIKKKISAINLQEIEYNLNKFMESKKISKEGDTFIIDCSKLRINKLLGRGHVKNKLKVTVDSASRKAIQRVKERGGEVITKKHITK